MNIYRQVLYSVFVIFVFTSSVPNQINAQTYQEIKKLSLAETSEPSSWDDYLPGGFGYSIDIDGKWLAIGAPKDTVIKDNHVRENAGALYIFNKNAGGNENWGFVEMKATSQSYVGIGTDVDIDGSQMIMAATNHVEIYLNDPDGETIWDFEDAFSASEISDPEKYEENLGKLRAAIIDDFAFIGVPFDTSQDHSFIGSGNLKIIKKVNTNRPWNHHKTIEPPIKHNFGSFGNAIDAHGHYLIVGEKGSNHLPDRSDYKASAGAAHIYHRNEGGNENWGLVKTITASDRKGGDEFGISVAISKDYAAVGAYNAAVDGQSNAGAVYIFGKNFGGENNWGEVQKLISSDLQEGANFGSSVDIYNDRLIVGAMNENLELLNNELLSTGAAHIFHRTSDNIWSEVQEINGSETLIGDQFGTSVAISDNYSFVGAVRGDSATNDNTGSVYIFENPTVTSVENEEEKPTEYTLSQNYPNPFNPATTIEFSLKEKSDVSLIIYDSIGRRVEQLVDAKLSSGNHSVKFNAKNLSSGIYFYKLTAGNKFIETKKMMLIK